MDQSRLRPQMRSRKLQALDFVLTFFARWGHSPSLSEIAAELGVSVQRARELVRKLSDERQFKVLRGKARGIRLNDPKAEISDAEALLKLSAAGWTISAGKTIVGPDRDAPFTKNRLPYLPVLDHLSAPGISEAGTMHGDQSD